MKLSPEDYVRFFGTPETRTPLQDVMLRITDDGEHLERLDFALLVKKMEEELGCVFPSWEAFEGCLVASVGDAVGDVVLLRGVSKDWIVDRHLADQYSTDDTAG